MVVVAVLRMKIPNQSFINIQTIFSSDKVFPPFLHCASAVAIHEKQKKQKIITL
jgi:hypothetical protein